MNHHRFILFPYSLYAADTQQFSFCVYVCVYCMHVCVCMCVCVFSSVDCSVLCVRMLSKLLHHHIIYKDVFREVGLIEVMVTCLLRYAALLKDSDCGPGTACIIVTIAIVVIAAMPLCCPHMWSRNKINSVLATVYFISAPDNRTYKAEMK